MRMNNKEKNVMKDEEDNELPRGLNIHMSEEPESLTLQPGNLCPEDCHAAEDTLEECSQKCMEKLVCQTQKGQKSNQQFLQCFQTCTFINRTKYVTAVNPKVDNKHASEWDPLLEPNFVATSYFQTLDQSLLDVSVSLHDYCRRWPASKVHTVSSLQENDTALKDTSKFENHCCNSQNERTISSFTNNNCLSESTIERDLKKLIEKIVIKTENGKEILIKVELNDSDDSETETGKVSMKHNDSIVRHM